jgi:hypothetical protein
MALALNKIILANAATNTAGAYLQTVTISSVGIGNATLMNAGTSSAQTVPAGLYILPQTTNNVAIEVNAYTGTANAWTTYIAANTGGTVFSDGYNVRANATTSTQTLTLYTVNGGNAAAGTYNS